MSPRRPRRAGGTLRDGERRQLALASRRAASAPPRLVGRERVLCDGGSRGNPGPAAIAAVVITADGEVAARRAVRIGRATAAEAEHRAILLGLELASAAGLTNPELRSDSQLALAWAQDDAEVRRAAEQFASVAWRWHPRHENVAADELV